MGFMEGVVKEVRINLNERDIPNVTEDVKVVASESPQITQLVESMTGFLSRLEHILRPTLQTAASSTWQQKPASVEQFNLAERCSPIVLCRRPVTTQTEGICS